MKKWIAHSEGFAKGTLHLNREAMERLLSDKAVSILPVGIMGWREIDKTFAAVQEVVRG